jgi:biotin carboxyl carrier protein
MKVVATLQGRDYEVEVEEIEQDRFRFTLDGQSFEMQAVEPLPNVLSLILDHDSFEVGLTEPDAQGVVGTHFFDESCDVLLTDPMRKLLQASSRLRGDTLVELRAEMPGKVQRILVEEGQEVQEGQPLLVLVAMKMENALEAPSAGKIKGLAVTVGQNVETGALLLHIG